MKRAIISLAIGNPDPYRVGLESALEYSKKIGADFYVISEPVVNYRFPHFEKLQLLGLFDQGYDRILYLDGDTIVTPHAKDIFEEYPDEEKFYAYDENSNPDKECMNRDPDVEALPKDFEWAKNADGKYRYFNAGVMLFSKKHRLCFSGVESLPNVPEMWQYAEQTALNYLIAKNGVEWESIDYNFNRMDLGQEDSDKLRFKADIIHYAGPCLYKEEDQQTKYHQMIKDWEVLNNDKS
jgi:lipopolysaccharide biosynthesis glycosyltransferase